MTRPTYRQMLDDPKLEKAARRIWEDHYAMERRTRWEELPDEVGEGHIHDKAFCLSLAWSAFETQGLNRL